MSIRLPAEVRNREASSSLPENSFPIVGQRHSTIIPEDRLDAAAALPGGLVSGKFEVTGTSLKGPFHFSFEDKPV
jgi:hypothetical protein